MLTEIKLKELGFYKDKHYRKKKAGVSVWSWYYDDMEIFTLEKHHIGRFDEGDTFYPTFRFNDFTVPIDNMECVNNVVRLLGLTEKQMEAAYEYAERQNHIYADIGLD